MFLLQTINQFILSESIHGTHNYVLHRVHLSPAQRPFAIHCYGAIGQLLGCTLTNINRDCNLSFASCKLSRVLKVIISHQGRQYLIAKTICSTMVLPKMLRFLKVVCTELA